VKALLTKPSLLKRLLSSGGSSGGFSSLCSLLLATLLVASLVPQTAHAIPVFARQTQQNCVACHVGGQYPELTPYGRYFKLTGYTQGVTQITPDGVGIPLAFSLQAGVNKMSNNKDSTGVGIDPRNGRFAPDQASVYSGGRIADNVGLFAQYTAAFDQGDSHHTTFGADNVDLRYADHLLLGGTDLIWGLSLNNNPGLTDVFNSTPAWSYPYQYSASGTGTSAPVQTALEATYGGGTARGLNGYLYLSKSFYAEFGTYAAAKGPFQIMTFVTPASDTGSNNGTAPLKGGNPYYRLAYTTEWGPSNLMVGAFGMNSKLDNLGDGTTTTYKDRGLDAQYQYISDPHVVSTQLRYLSEKITDESGQFAGPANLKSFYAKAMYVYRAKYGAGLSYQSEKGTSDPFYGTLGAPSGAGANFVSANNSPNSTVWTPAIFWQPLQNVRVTLYKTFFTKFLGGKDNYDGNGRNAKDNNTTYLYLWIDF
jgi:hypothetical protein